MDYSSKKSLEMESTLSTVLAMNISEVVGTTDNDTGGSTNKKTILPDDAAIMITLYSCIFILCVLGNSLVILTLLQNKRMRSVTNVFLLNLAVSDLLLGVFCMPFTLIGSLLRNFIFGDVMCILINYFQGVSVSVGVWTLVSISLERYFAICRPLHSRQWQTISHSYKIIFLVWAGSLATMLPSVLLSRRIPLKSPGKYKCREIWPNEQSERIFNIYLDIVFLVIPLIIMTLVYSLIARKLCIGTRMKFFSSRKSSSSPQSEIYSKKMHSTCIRSANANGTHLGADLVVKPRYSSQPSSAIRGAYDKSQAAKTRVVRMLFVVVVEFFVCWTPLYVVNTWALFDAKSVYTVLGYAGFTAVYLLAYISSCCNPLTYCFMHKKYRQGFLSIIGCKKNKRWKYNQQSERSGTMVSVFSTKAGSVRSEAVDRGFSNSSC